jgi:penicillin-binding protein 1A
MTPLVAFRRSDDSPLAVAVRQARRGPRPPQVPVELAAAVRGRVRKWPVVVINTVLLVVTADLAGSLYLREALGVKLLDAYRANLVAPSESVVTDSAGRRIGTLAAADAVREPLEHVPPIFHDALIRWEDARFLTHDGVDRYRMAGAVAALLRGDPQGGSTLTMQLAKLIKKDSARTLRRKLEDIALALALDSRLGKDEVLKDYANQAYFGSGVYGLGQACRYYFNREDCQGLTLPEAAYLVSLLRAPADLSRDESRARNRRNAVIEQMREPSPALACRTRFDRVSRSLYLRMHGFLEHEVAGRNDLGNRYPPDVLDASKRTPLGLVRDRPASTHPFVLETARQELQKRLGSGIYENGLAVRLTIDSSVQAMAEHALGVGLDNLRKLQGIEATGSQDDDLDGGVVVIDPRTGHMLAYVPGADFRTSQVPFAARPIQVGSSLKPFVYGEFFEQGKGDIDTTLLDAPICFGKWCPKNYDGKYHGVVPVWFALSRSLNTVAVRVADTIGVDSIVARLRLLGVQSPLTANLPMALGASELSLLELAGLYASLYDGRVVHPRLVLDVRNRKGDIIYGGDEPDRPQGFQATTIEQLHRAMGEVLQPGGTAAPLGRDLTAWFNVPKDKKLGADTGASPQLACKTGTHDGFIRVGMGCVVSDTDYGPVVVVTYVGHRVPKSLGAGLTGGRVAGPIMADLIRAMTVKTKAAGVFRPFPTLEDESPGAPARQAAPVVAAKAASDDQNVVIAEALQAREASDPAGAAFAAGRTTMVNAGSAALGVATTAVTIAGEAADALAARGVESKALIVARPAASGLSLEAPRDWEGLKVLDADTIEASGPEIVKAFLDAGGREEELADIAPILDMVVEKHVIHQHRLLAPGFSEQPLTDRFLLLSNRVLASLTRMLDPHPAVTEYSHPDPLTHILSEADGDRRIERTYRFDAPIRMFRVTRHQTTGEILAIEWIGGDGARHAVVRRGDRLAALSVRRVVVDRGSLEPSWISAGMSPASLDGLRGLVGASVNIDHIPRGFQLQLLLADGALIGVDSERPPTRPGEVTERAGAIRTDGACLALDGAPCLRRLLPLPLAEAHVYGRRAATQRGAVLVQRDQPAAMAYAPANGRVAIANADRGLVVLDIGDGGLLRLEGVKPSVPAGTVVRLGEPIGRLDARGVAVLHASHDLANGHVTDMDVMDALPDLNGGDESLRAVSAWWHELHAWLRGDLPATTHEAPAHPS